MAISLIDRLLSDWIILTKFLERDNASWVSSSWIRSCLDSFVRIMISSSFLIRALSWICICFSFMIENLSSHSTIFLSCFFFIKYVIKYCLTIVLNTNKNANLFKIIPYKRGLFTLYLIQRESKSLRVSAHSLFSIKPKPVWIRYGLFQASRISRKVLGVTKQDEFLKRHTRIVVICLRNWFRLYKSIDNYSPNSMSFILLSNCISRSACIPTCRTDVTWTMFVLFHLCSMAIWDLHNYSEIVVGPTAFSDCPIALLTSDNTSGDWA